MRVIPIALTGNRMARKEKIYRARQDPSATENNFQLAGTAHAFSSKNHALRSKNSALDMPVRPIEKRLTNLQVARKDFSLPGAK